MLLCYCVQTTYPGGKRYCKHNTTMFSVGRAQNDVHIWRITKSIRFPRPEGALTFLFLFMHDDRNLIFVRAQSGLDMTMKTPRIIQYCAYNTRKLKETAEILLTSDWWSKQRKKIRTGRVVAVFWNPFISKNKLLWFIVVYTKEEMTQLSRAS